MVGNYTGEQVVSNVKADLALKANPERREKAKNYFPTAMEVMGVSVKDIRSILKPLFHSYKHESAEKVMDLARLLVKANVHEMRQMAYELIERHKPSFMKIDREILEELGHGMDNWATVDCFCVSLSGRAWQQSLVDDGAIEDWAHSANRWWRRAALVSTVPLNLKSRGGYGDPKRTFHICGILAGDHDDMVVKALSWSLREYAKRDKAAVKKFIDQNRDKLHSRVMAEVNRKIHTGKKSG